MEFRNINTFLTVAEFKSFSKAANKLGYSQSNVSLQIQQLEKELGVQLFERTGKSIRITDAGQDFLFYANEIQRLNQQALNTVKIPKEKKKENICGQLRIGSIESIATAILPDLLTGFHQLYPQIQISVCIESGNTLVDMIRNNEIDLFFILDEKMTIPNMKRQLLSKEEIIFLSAIPYNVEDGTTISLEELSQKDFVLTEPGEGYRKQLDHLLGEYNLTITPIIEFANPETVIQFVERKIGLSFLPYFCAEEKIKSGKLFQVETNTPPIYMYNQIFYHKDKWITPQMEVLLDYVKDFFNSADINA